MRESVFLVSWAVIWNDTRNGSVVISSNVFLWCLGRLVAQEEHR